MKSGLLNRIIFIIFTLLFAQFSYADANDGVVVDDGGNLKMAPQGSQQGAYGQFPSGPAPSPYGTGPAPSPYTSGQGMSGGATNVPVPGQQMSPQGQMPQSSMPQDGSSSPPPGYYPQGVPQSDTNGAVTQGSAQPSQMEPPPGWVPPPGAVKQDQMQSSGSSGM